MISASGQRPRAALPLRARIVQWTRGPTFARDIVLVLAIKLVLLLALKYAFFNHPQAEDMRMAPAAVAQAILSVPMPPTAAPPASPSQQGTQRGNPQGERHAHD
ncbi:cytochrome oxidase putative small subunit CydP [Paraburkholderia unamae]|uniref:Uncharacterized protein n=1 Tax=Paraburkholderia unamae TaxID=219649 RepID=A0ABX5KW78_9BURK|nr:cytochrome oxidase putative small subunit CydP [Paraburkholderia unamae]PVX97832.1 hypothetical protein C7402_101546 [Paraburkholderia unamae]